LGSRYRLYVDTTEKKKNGMKSVSAIGVIAQLIGANPTGIKTAMDAGNFVDGAMYARRTQRVKLWHGGMPLSGYGK